VLAIWAQSKVKAAFRQWSQVPTRAGVTGAEVARLILRSRGITDVEVEPTKGMLTDHYNPLEKKLRLSEANYSGSSVAAVGVAAHEVGHAIQHADGYPFLQFRSIMVPVVRIGSMLSGILIPIGFLLLIVGRTGGGLAVPVLTVAAYGLAAVVLFSLVTLPVEIDASRRALKILGTSGMLVEEELDGTRHMLRAAAYTYVASAAVAIVELVRVLFLLAAARRN
jgi:hypothetical protein